jgi:hypothetical protein
LQSSKHCGRSGYSHVRLLQHVPLQTLDLAQPRHPPVLHIWVAVRGASDVAGLDADRPLVHARVAHSQLHHEELCNLFRLVLISVILARGRPSQGS